MAALKVALHARLQAVKQEIKDLKAEQDEIELALEALRLGPDVIYPRDVTCP